MRMDRGGAIAGVRCRSESAAGITKPISGFVKRLSAAGNETFFASCVAQEAKRGSFSGPALRRKQKGGLFRALRCAGSKKGSFSGPALCRKQKRVFFGPCVAQEAKRGLFRALRCAGSKKGVFFGPCVAQEAKRGSFSGPALCRKQKRVFFGPCVAQEAKRGSFSGPALRRKQKRPKKGRPLRWPPLCISPCGGEER